MNNAASQYFREEFDLTTESAAAVASLFGWMNLFARGLGGYVSDIANSSWGMPGRLWVQTICLALEGVFVLIFANSKSLAGAILVMVFFSIFVQAAEGTSYGKYNQLAVVCWIFVHNNGGAHYVWLLCLFQGIVPYVDEKNLGTVTGIVGAGGNVGAVAFGFAFRQLQSNKTALTIMGATVLGSSILSLFIVIEGHDSVICRSRGEDDEEAPHAENKSLSLCRN
jgi:NNP family nitrate/nitrite transporter-like MFS transporter